MLAVGLLLVTPCRVWAGPVPVVAIDVGHSLAVPGAISARGATEFSFNQALAGQLGAALVARGNQAYLINADGALADLSARDRQAEHHHAGFFLSVHHDSAQPQFLKSWSWQGQTYRYSDRFSGYSLFVSRKNHALARSLACASQIGASLRGAGFHPSEHHAAHVAGESKPWADRANGVYYYDNLVVLKGARSPAVLLEAGVIVNRDDELLLGESTARERMARAVAEGLAHCGVAL